MYTNEFGQTIKADWAMLTVKEEDLQNFATVIMRSIVRNSDVGATVITLEDEYTYGALNATGVETLEEVDLIHKAFGLDIYAYDEDSKELIFNDEGAAFQRVIVMIFGEGAEYRYEADGVYVITMPYDGYMTKSLGI